MAENKKLRSMSFPGLSGIYDLAPQWENVENKPEELNELRGAAIGQKGTAEGAEIFNNYDNNVASGYDSHAEGHYTTASGDHSHSEGGDTKASGINSHAEGDGTKATADAQHVQGRYNIEDTAKTYAHIVGNGTSSKRSNAHTVDWNGNANFAGDVYVGNADENKAGSKLATESFVTNKISEAQLSGGGDIDLSGYATKDDLNSRVPTSRTVNGKALSSNVTLSASDVGAISKDDLQEATNEALAQAKASGEFDGPRGPEGPQGSKGDPGATGAQGEPGKDGADGKTPVKGVDYWTAADKSAMVSDVLAALPTWNGGSY